MTPQGIKDLLLENVARNETAVHQVNEQRKVVVAVPEFRHGLFVELILTDDDPDCPSVLIVNAHEQLR